MALYQAVMKVQSLIYNTTKPNFVKTYAKPLCNHVGGDFKKYDLLGR